MISGILAVDKPQGWTSHDVVARVRRVAGQRQVGHAGTLDPLATGLLLIVLGRATRLSSHLMQSEKVYRAEIVLGAATNTDDAEGTITAQSPIPTLEASEIEQCIARFTGRIDQVPPAYAAVRQGGERQYRLARRGIEIRPEPRPVEIHEIRVEYFVSPRLRLWIRCGSGTYIRSLARDIGLEMGTCAYLHALRRLAGGSFSVHEALNLEGLSRETILASIAPLDRAVLTWPAIVLTPAQVEDVSQGRAIALGCPVQGNVRLYGPSGVLLALGCGADERVRPIRVFPEGDQDANRR